MANLNINLDNFIKEQKHHHRILQAFQGTFLVTLTLAGGFIAEILGCDIRNLLHNNIIAKHIFLLFFLIFTVNFSAGFYNTKPINPINNLFIAGIIYIGFIMFTHMDLNFVIAVFLLLALAYIFTRYVHYFFHLKHYKKEHVNKNEISHIITMRNILLYITLTTLIVGFIYKIIKSKKNTKSDWSLIKFLFSNRNCKPFK